MSLPYSESKKESKNDFEKTVGEKKISELTFKQQNSNNSGQNPAPQIQYVFIQQPYLYGQGPQPGMMGSQGIQGMYTHPGYTPYMYPHQFQPQELTHDTTKSHISPQMPFHS
jgi:hypothetical protein